MKNLAAIAVGIALISSGARADEPHQNNAGGATVSLNFAGKIPNLPGKSLKTVLVKYEPGASSPPHTHAKSAFILAYVLEGQVTSAVNGQPARTYRRGEFWTENPGDHHQVSANASKEHPAQVLAIFVVDTDDTELTTFAR